MDIGNIGTGLTNSVASTSSTTAIGATRNSSIPPAPSSASQSSSTIGLSGPGQFWSKLQNLMQTDPSQAKDALTQLAQQVRDAASSSSGDEQTRLNAFADKLQKAADSGNVSDLSPHMHGHGHGHHHGAPPSAAAGTAPSSASATAAYAAQAQSTGQDQWSQLWQDLNSTLDSFSSSAASSVQLG